MFFHKFDHILNKCGRFFNPHKGSLPPVSVGKLLSTSDIPNKNPSNQGDSYMPCEAMAHYPSRGRGGGCWVVVVEVEGGGCWWLITAMRLRAIAFVGVGNFAQF